MARAENNEVLILGGITHKNRGDLAMMDGLFTQLRQISPAIKPVLYSWNPEVSRRTFDVECRRSPDLDISKQFTKRTSRTLAIADIARFVLGFAVFHVLGYRAAHIFTRPDLLEFFAHVSRSRAVVIHGSGSFNSYWWYDWVYPKTACALVAKLSGTPVLLTSQGVGPFEHVLDKLVAATFMRASSFLGVRDANKSADTMRRLGASTARIWQTGDDALLLPELSGGETSALLDAEGLDRKEMLIGVNIRDASAYSSNFAEQGLEKVAAALAAITSRHDARLVFIPISYDKLDDDRKSAAAIASRIGDSVPITIVTNERSAAELRALTGRMHICVGISYHFLLFALSANVPSIALFRNDYYRQKQTGLMDLFGQRENCVDIAEATEEGLAEKLAQLIKERDTVSLELETANAQLAERATAARRQFMRIIDPTLAYES